MVDDAELLREYVERGSEEAFRILVERHSGMVHGVGLRITSNEQLAQEITQAVFVILTRKAAGLRPKIVLAGWLYHTARFVALEAMRADRRRLQREEQMRHVENSDDGMAVWEQIAPQVDDALGRLGKTDRDALVLRFLEQRSFAEVASALGISEAAAKMRVGRALDKLRSSLVRCGVMVPSAALLTALSTCGVSAVPPALSANVAGVALAASATTPSSITSLVKGALVVMAWNKAKTGITIAVVILLLGGGGVATWKWQARHLAPGFTSPQPVMRTFEPMAGEWEGTVTLKRDGRVITDDQPCSMSVTTQQNGRACEIELRMRFSPDAEPVAQHYAHRLNERGDRLFTISDPASGRGDGDCEVTESVHNPAAGEWRAAMRFPLPGDRGIMEGSWERHGDTLVVRSHDEFFAPGGSTHVHAEIQLRRSAGTTASITP